MRYAAVAIFLLAFAGFAVAQETYTVDGFSDKYFGKVHIDQPSEVFSPGWVAIYDKKTKKQLIKVTADELTKSEHEGKVVANVKELPYGEQSSIMHEDYNFDGRKDFAIMDGQNSCYHGPSFRIYLATATGLKFSPPFTKLAQENCGMFEIDAKTKRISTMTKDGCCWHQFAEYVVSGNAPVAVKIVEEGVNPNGLLVDYVEKNRVGGRMVATKYSALNVDDLEGKIVYSLDFPGERKMRIINSEGVLSYAFTGPEDKIELIHTGRFVYDRTANVLSFAAGKTRYEIAADSIAVKSARPDRVLKPLPGTANGSLTQLASAKLENLTVK